MTEQERVIMIPHDPLAWLRKEWIRRPLTGLVFARGDWCPFCVHNVNQWLEQLPRLQELGGAVFLVTSQAGDILEKSATNWSRMGVPVISDPENLLAKEMGITISKRAIRPSFQPTFDSYKNGVNQAGFVMFDQRGQEIIGWGATSTEYNIGGALDRPVPAQVVDYLERKLRRKPRPQPRVSAINKSVKLKTLLPPLAEDADDGIESIELDDYAEVVDEIFDALPGDFQALILQQGRLPPGSKRLVEAESREARSGTLIS